MDSKTFKAMVVQEKTDGTYTRRIAEKSLDDLPAGEVLVRVHYSSLNYKDGLSATGHRGVTKNYPHTPGVDAAGVVEESLSEAFQPGDEVIVTSYDLGMNTPGGFGQYIRVPAGWVVPLPENLSPKESMAYGSAGLTAGFCIFKLQEHAITPERGEILVTGATGGVGSFAVAMLAKIGYQVVAVTGKIDEKQFLIDLGAKEVISRDAATDISGKPLLKGRWAGVVDAVGGEILSTAIRATKLHGAVTCCGNVASPDLPINVYPFILRGISLVGIDSQSFPMTFRRQTWEKIATDWKLDNLDRQTSVCSLEELDSEIDLILAGKQKGRVIVDLER
ncbi:MAG: YhdH/YhfP family quinone oxidoreductase [Deltaproteobacteria bacterium]|nr:YhdH/YhfP family quinone oxidoreductase [Deltaproteobacteria bacterium]MDH3803764.1 YhdH/YhfP family quinone oxidoreductase [Deltaproteobacteria bacterium]MDH3964737.1 YhdH/YhfP family quinone oxidoreductase [Deltaproteobacteria bacterium]